MEAGNISGFGVERIFLRGIFGFSLGETPSSGWDIPAAAAGGVCCSGMLLLPGITPCWLRENSLQRPAGRTDGAGMLQPEPRREPPAKP